MDLKHSCKFVCPVIQHLCSFQYEKNIVYFLPGKRQVFLGQVLCIVYPVGFSIPGDITARGNWRGTDFKHELCLRLLLFSRRLKKCISDSGKRGSWVDTFGGKISFVPSSPPPTIMWPPGPMLVLDYLSEIESISLFQAQGGKQWVTQLHAGKARSPPLDHLLTFPEPLCSLVPRQKLA